MTQDEIMRQIYMLYRSGKSIHIAAQPGLSKDGGQKIEARITGVYPRLFLIEEQSAGVLKRHSFKYTDILTGHVSISEIK